MERYSFCRSNGRKMVERMLWKDCVDDGRDDVVIQQVETPE